jgi:pimeloyl-ACP methyl ester carboxylesterase
MTIKKNLSTETGSGRGLRSGRLTASGPMRKLILAACAAISFSIGTQPGVAETSPPLYGAELEGFDYPYPAQQFEFESQGQTLHMTYMDVAAKHSNGKVAVMLHGKLYCSATWGETIKELTEIGFRVVAVDQIGFCKSSKPQAYQFTFRQLAENTHRLLQHLGIAKATLIGHSTGGMLGLHYALLYPSDLHQLVLVNPIGLEDWTAKGVPSISVDDWYKRELQFSADELRRYQTRNFYAGQWDPSYEHWVEMLAGLKNGPGRKEVAWDSALLDDMVMTQPVLYRLREITTPTLLLIGTRDKTAFGREFASSDVASSLGDYTVLGKTAAAALPHGKLVEFPTLAHSPLLSDPAAFYKALRNGLDVD